ncbi:YbaB/EbfC family nucleoid-associated protein [Mycobacterium sp. pUA109]|uniref:YbaB/EbfC family nucleoid-associated protein n=1 Tax=Mycobacterium sp. pUA109 TaxID=3238982 RepID=UPI00351BDE6C
MEDVLARVQEQMGELAAIQQKQAALTALATAADGTVEVSVDAHGKVIKTVIDEFYLEEFDFADLGGYITAAAQAAARDVNTRAAELMVPLREARQKFPSLSDIVDGAPDLRSLFDDLHADDGAVPSAEDDNGWDEPTVYPTVRR